MKKIKKEKNKGKMGDKYVRFFGFIKIPPLLIIIYLPANPYEERFFGT